MKYKVGDRVRIKSIDWYNDNKNEYGIIGCGNANFIPDMKIYCGDILTICDINEELSYYYVTGCQYTFKDEMIEGLVEEEMFIKANDIYNEEYSKGEYCHEQSFKWGFQEGYNYSHENDKLEISLKEGYIFKDENGNVINATKIVLEKKKKEYPKTYETCCKVLNLPVRDLDILDNMLDTTEIIYSKNLDRLLNSFRKILICRDAYWKIAGEEMGLGKPWEPSKDKIAYSIYRYSNEIETDFSLGESVTFEFPTEEMRDAFYENFKELINECKELL